MSPFYIPSSLAGLLGDPDVVLIVTVDEPTMTDGTTVIGRADDGTEVTLKQFHVPGIAILIPQDEADVMHEQLIVTIDGAEYRCTPCRGKRQHYHIRGVVGDEGNATA